MTGCGAGPVVLAATQTGGSHEASGVPCQDAYAWAEAGCGVLVIAVSDGVGTAPRSDEGAAVAVEAAVNGALAAGADESVSHDLEGLVRLSACAARAAVDLPAPAGPSIATTAAKTAALEGTFTLGEEDMRRGP